MDIQHLRCKVNFQALVFVPHIRTLGDALISRLRNPQHSTDEMGSNYLQEVTDADDSKNAGKFVVLHLRFDKVFFVFHYYCLSIQGCKLYFCVLLVHGTTILTLEEC